MSQILVIVSDTNDFETIQVSQFTILVEHGGIFSFGNPGTQITRNFDTLQLLYRHDIIVRYS